MSDTPPNIGPSHETLAKLAGMIPSFMRSMKKQKIVGRGTPVRISRPRKVCKVCGLLYDHAMLPPSDDIEIKPEFCATCGPLMEQGHTALVCGDKYAIVYFQGTTQFMGSIVFVKESTMEAIEKEFGVSRKKSNGHKPDPASQA